MALVSPGVEVSIIDESAYRSATTNSVPFLLIATAQNKVNSAGTGVAQGTTQANANNTYLITSQRELVNTFGNPFFYNTTAGTPINGYELNEYGLLAAYSVLGVSNRAYIQRVDIDLAELAASLTRPTGNPDNNTWWLDTNNTTWGIFEWSLTTSSFTNKVPKVITSADDLSAGVPQVSFGSIGDYAVVATNVNNPVYYKSSDNEWVLVGSNEWKSSRPAVTGTVSNPVLNASDQISITIGGSATIITLTGTTASSLASDINTAAISGVTAEVLNDRLVIYLEDEATLANITNTPLADAGITAGTFQSPALQQSKHTSIPRWRSTDTEPRPTGSVWVKTSSVNNGMNIVVKRYNAATDTFGQQSVPVYASDAEANYELDRTGGGQNIAESTTYALYDTTGAGTATVKVFERLSSGDTVVVANETAPVLVSGNTFTISASEAGSTNMTTPVTTTVAGTTAYDFVSAVSAAGVENVSATVLTTGAIQLTHTQGGVIELKDTAGTPTQDAGLLVSVDGINQNYTNGVADGVRVSNWAPMTDPDGNPYSASNDAPGQDPVEGSKWYYSSISEIDVMMHDGSNWKGYNNVSNDVRGFDLTTCDPNGVQVSASAPTTQSDNSALVNGDIWIDSSDLENFPVIKRWETVEGVNQWVTLDNTDQTTENGVVFADARWAVSGEIDPVADDMSTIKSLTTSDYLDLDAPDPSLYPAGTLLFNTRRSGYNVKEFRSNYFNASDFDGSLPTEKNTWVTVSGEKFGRHSQRQVIVAAMKSAVDANTTIREEQRVFNLIAAPGYPELMPNLVALNNDRNNTGFVIGDTPLRLEDSGTGLVNWATNANSDGLAVNDEYLGVFYPSGQTNDLSGNTVVVPASHMMLRTIIRSDEVGYPWLAPAGIRRGNIDNVSALGYVDSDTGRFVTVATRAGIRDTLYENNVNPITFIPGTGLVNYGNKTTAAGTALDRINVARLVSYIRTAVESIGKGYIFEPNDKITRDEIKNQIEGLMNDLTAKRGIYDYLVVCDESNNTPSRIDRNELYVDIAVEPTKAVEYVYIPVRIKNTGEIDAGL